MVCTNNVGAFKVCGEVLKYEYLLQKQTKLGSKTLYSHMMTRRLLICKMEISNWCAISN